MNIIKKIIKLIIKYASAVMKRFFGILPIKNRVFFYSIRSDGCLEENSKCVYDALDAKKLFFAKKLPHSPFDIPKIFYLMSTSRVIVTDDYLKYLRSVKLRDEQKVIQLWHAGGAFKRFGLDAPSRMSRYDEINTHSQYSDVFVTSEYVKKYYAGAFGIDEEKIKPFGSPRTDKLFENGYTKAKKQKAVSQCSALKGKKVYLYLPTFREENGVQTVFNPQIDWNRLENSLYDDEIFVISRHPLVKYSFIENSSFSKIIDCTFLDTQMLMCAADVIITDYSSIIFDACLIEKPVVFFCPDETKYERGFYLNFPDDLPGNVVNDGDSLLTEIRSTVNNPPLEKMQSFTQRQMSACDGKSTDRITGYITDYLKRF